MGNKLLGRFRKDSSVGFTERQLGYINDFQFLNGREQFSQICNIQGYIVPEKLKWEYETTDDIATEVLKIMDFDDSGVNTVDFFEFKCFVSMMCQSPSTETANRLFDIFDIGEQNSQSVLDVEELFGLVKTVENYLAFLNDKPHSSDSEIKLKTQQLVQKWNYDKKGIGREKFQEMLVKDPVIQQWMFQMGFMQRSQYNPDDADLDDADSDLEVELDVRKQQRDLRIEKIKEGVQHIPEEQQESVEIQLEGQRNPGDPLPWANSVTPPSEFKKKGSDSKAPNVGLEIEYVHGYRCFDCRNNLQYGPQNEIIYQSGAMGIVMDSKTLNQKFYMDHTDDITCLDVSDNLVATGQVGMNPIISVWNCDTLQSVLVIKGDLKEGIGAIAISSDGNYLAAVSMEQQQYLAIYDMQRAIANRNDPKSKDNGLVGQITKTCQAQILSMQFANNQDLIILGCMKVVMFISFEKGTIHAVKGMWGTDIIPEAILSIAFIQGQIVTGGFSGCMIEWKDFKVQNHSRAHQTAITALCSRGKGKGLISGSNSGEIKFWNNKLEFERMIQVDEIKGLQFEIVHKRLTSLIESEVDGSLLVGLAGSQIVQFQGGNSSRTRVIMNGHYKGTLWGLATHPFKLEYLTAGSEGILSLWSMQRQQLIKRVDFQYPLTIVNYSPNGKYIALATQFGNVFLLDQNLKQIKNLDEEADPDKQVIGSMKFSPNSQLLVVTFNPPHNHILVYDAKHGFQKPQTIRGPPSSIINFDFSCDGNSIIINQQDQQIAIYNLSTGLQQRYEKHKSEKWATWTCTMGWASIGIWPSYSMGPDINTIDRSFDHRYLVTGDDFSQVKVFQYPCYEPGSSFLKASGHSSQISCVRFSFDSQYVISIGAEEKTIIQWQMQRQENDAADQVQDIAAELEGQQKNQEEEKAAQDDDDIFGAEELDQGDQAGAMKPFLGEVSHSIPSWFKANPKRDNVLPDGNIELHYAHGYRYAWTFDQCRDMVKYTDKDCLVTVGGAVGIKQERKPGGQQWFYINHEEDIVSFDVNPVAKSISASGQMAMKGKKTIDLHVWDSDTMTTLCTLNDFHRRAITNLKFSPNGTLLLSVGQDDDNSLAIYEWKMKRLVCTSPVDKAKVTSCAWKNDNKSFITTGMKHVQFWTLDGRNVQGQMGRIEGPFDTQFTSIFAFNSTLAVTGGGSGKLYTWLRTSGKAVEAHASQTSTLFSDDQNSLLYSGGFDGKVICWTKSSNTIVKQSVFLDLAGVVPPKVPSGVLSIDMNQKGDMLVGTYGAQIWEKTTTGKPNLLLQGHYNTGELWGLAVSHQENKFATSGSDFRIRIWSIQLGIMTAMTEPFEVDIRAVDWSPQGGFIVGADMAAVLHLVDTKSGQILDKLVSKINGINSKSKEQKWVEDIQFNPVGDKVAFGAHGCLSPINIVWVKDGKFGKQITLDMAFSSSILHLDWSQDGGVIVANSQAYELRFCSTHYQADVKGGKAPIPASGTQDIQWASWTCQLGFPVQGVFQGVDYTDVNSCVRSNSNKYLASGNDDSLIQLFKYPVVVPKQVHKDYKGHSSHITQVRFTYSDNFLVSTGGLDRMVMIWKTTFGGISQQDQAEREKAMRQELNQDEELDAPQQRVVKGNQKQKTVEKQKDENDEQIFDEEEKDAGDQFMACKPWLGAIKPPSQPYFKDPKQSEPPPIDLKLEYVHGFRSKDQRNNLRWLTDTKIVYNAAAAGIVHDISQNTQTHFTLHNDDILSLDVHPNGQLIATGELGPKPVIYIWAWETMEVVHRFSNVVQKGVCCLAFSPSGEKLACAAIDDEHFIGIMDLRNDAFISFKGDKSQILDLDWRNQNEFVTTGPKLYKIWQSTGNSYKDTRGGTPLASGCGFASPSECFVGTASGEILIYNETQVTQTIQVHSAPCQTIVIHNDYVISGGRDKTVNFINKKSPYDIVCSLQIETIIPQEQRSFSAQVRSVCLNEDQTRLLVGTLGSQIYEFEIKEGIKRNANVVFKKKHQQGHYTPNQAANEVWGLSIFRDEDRFVTCSDDCSIRIWSHQRNQIIQSQRININLIDVLQQNPENLYREILDKKTGDSYATFQGRRIQVSPDGKTIVVGCKDGTVRVFDGDLNQLQQFQHSQKEISEIKFSPDGSTVAIGSHDNSIYAYKLPDWKAICKPMKKHSSTITHFDFSQDGNSLHSTCQAYQLLFWDVNSGKQLTSGATVFRDEKWATWTTTLGWPVAGIWPECADGTDINAVDRSPYTLNGKNEEVDYHLLVTGDDFSQIRVMRYPSLKQSSKGVVKKVHSSHVTCVRWNNTNSVIYSTGGEDQCVMVWNIQKL